MKDIITWVLGLYTQDWPHGRPEGWQSSSHSPATITGCHIETRRLAIFFPLSCNHQRVSCKKIRRLAIFFPLSCNHQRVSCKKIRRLAIFFPLSCNHHRVSYKDQEAGNPPPPQTNLCNHLRVSYFRTKNTRCLWIFRYIETGSMAGIQKYSKN